ncbi:hypothetical protein QO003_000851 [Arthrobacter silviterrae]|uniref:Uncharacterized protein n=1 Tax=Arthrobacter silviterrae TaxID=2026658 RepID=A0ABX0DD58_9MICC|nr:hypothetical protein [Arthrobacter silviterrae]MDQ0276548.1 hypothetical protein [Arthrobacter silviterrae]NGN84829.1 hypothetical protein [Arthrobacter silviterrae]
MLDTKAIIALLEKNGKLTELTKTTTFHGRHESAGEVEVTIYDSGIDGHLRYDVVARSLNLNPERVTFGNPSDSLEVAIVTNHWDKLDG